MPDMIAATMLNSSSIANMKKAQNMWDALQKSCQRMGQVLNNTGTKLSGFISVSAGIGAIQSDIADVTKSVADRINAETELNTAMRKTKGIVLSNTRSVREYAAQLQALGVMGNEVILSGEQQIASYQLQTNTIKKLLPGMNDLLMQQRRLGTVQEAAVNIGDMLGKSIQAQTGVLNDEIIGFSQAQEQISRYNFESQNAAFITDVLQFKIWGVNQAIAQMNLNNITLMTGAWMNMQAVIGGLISSVVTFAAQVNTVMPVVQAQIQSVAAGLQQVFGQLEELRKQGLPSGAGNGGVPGSNGEIGASGQGTGNQQANSNSRVEYFEKGFGQVLSAAALGFITGGPVAPMSALKAGIGSAVSYFGPDIANAIGKARYNQLYGNKDNDQYYLNVDEMIHNEALGTRYFGGGLTWVGERGPELVNLPGGSKVYTNAESRQMANSYSLLKTADTLQNPQNDINLTVNINGANLSIREIMNQLIPELELAMANAV